MTIKLDNERLTKAQVCSILRIGYSTLGRWMRDGKIKFERDTTLSKFNCSVFFRRADLAEWMPCAGDSPGHPMLGELPPTSEGNLPSHPKRNAAPSLVGHYEEEPITEFGDDPIANARGWAEGTIKDSAGNANFGKELVDGSIVDKRSLIHDHPGLVSCGPSEVDRDCTSHMNQALVGTTGAGAGEGYLDSLERHRDVGSLSQAAYDRLTANARRARQSDQQRKQVVDVAVIRAAFRQGYSR